MEREIAKELLKRYGEVLMGDNDPEMLKVALKESIRSGEDFEDKSISDRAYSLVDSVMGILEDRLTERGIEVKLFTNAMCFMSSDEHEVIGYDSRRRAVITIQNFKNLSAPFTKKDLVYTLISIWNDSVKQVKKVYGVEFPKITLKRDLESIFDETLKELEEVGDEN